MINASPCIRAGSMMSKITEIYSSTLNTPLRLGLVSLVLSEILTLGAIFALGETESVLLGAIIAGVCGFFIAYGASHIFLKYQEDIETKNIQLEMYQRELRLAKENLEKRVEERTRDLLDANQQITNSLREKEVLLKEIHHRVKNNLQIVSSLLYLQSRRIADVDTVSLFEDSKQRIFAMALVHETLYSSNDLSRIDFFGYVKMLVAELEGVYQQIDLSITCLVEIEKGITLDIDCAIPCGLIVNELVSNAFKHAFRNSPEGTILVRMTKDDQEKIILSVIDDGVGLPTDFDVSDSSNMGLEIVSLLVTQLGGEMDIVSDQGTRIEIDFEENACE